MACNSDFVQFIVDQCSGAGEIAVKKMMGDYCIYCDGVLFGLICDNNLYIKQTDAGEAVLEEVVLRPPYPSALEHFYITNVDDRDYLEDIIRATLSELMSGKSKAKRARDSDSRWSFKAGCGRTQASPSAMPVKPIPL